MNLTPDQVAVDLVTAVVVARGEGFDWLTDADRAELCAAIDSDAPGAERFARAVAVIDARVTDADVTRFIRSREES